MLLKIIRINVHVMYSYVKKMNHQMLLQQLDKHLNYDIMNICEHNKQMNIKGRRILKSFFFCKIYCLYLDHQNYLNMMNFYNKNVLFLIVLNKVYILFFLSGSSDHYLGQWDTMNSPDVYNEKWFHGKISRDDVDRFPFLLIFKEKKFFLLG